MAPLYRRLPCSASLLLLTALLGTGVQAQDKTQPKPVAAAKTTAKPYPGYTMVGIGTTAYLYDMLGKVVHEWKVAAGRIKTTPYLLADGSVLFPLNKGGYTFRAGGAHASGTFQRVSWDGELLWDFAFYGEDFTPSYDVEPMPNGNILVCASFADRSRPGKLFEIEPKGKKGGEVVWECNVSDKLGPKVKGYINSVSYNAMTDRVLVNIQSPGRTLAVFDRKKKGVPVVFQWNKGFAGRIHGGCWITDRYLGSGLNIPGADAKAMRLGNILTISNTDNQAVEIDPRTRKRVRTFDYETPEKSRRAASHQGSVQRLPNGNTLIVPGYSETIREVDGTGKVAWTLKVPKRVPRAYRYGLSFPGLAKLKKKR